MIDGMHRLQAAIQRGESTIEVDWFDGTAEDAFVEAVRANTSHGLPLTLADREAAAMRIIHTHPQFSDRRVAAITALAPSTVAAIRQRCQAASDTGARIGRDGRIRPLVSVDGRRAAQEVIAAHPNASLRMIAKKAGISPTTARDVRERMRRGEDPIPPGLSRRGSAGQKQGRARTERKVRRPKGIGTDRGRLALLQDLCCDPSLRYTQPGRHFLQWLKNRAAPLQIQPEQLSPIPTHTLFLVAQIAHQCADEWSEFAEKLEERLQDAKS
ncbi:MAG TPA: streptomycin biosynthesis protein [Streptosporangiaceae bacterium]|nr:streptomycin biosynthesis protein [Streptosporangiaceae bacterium]